jgi:hypothetical protein
MTINSFGNAILVLGMLFALWAVYANRHAMFSDGAESPCDAYEEMITGEEYSLQYGDRVRMVVDGCL